MANTGPDRCKVRQCLHESIDFGQTDVKAQLEVKSPYFSLTCHGYAPQCAITEI